MIGFKGNDRFGLTLAGLQHDFGSGPKTHQVLLRKGVFEQ